ncbi:MAG: hypothetical protein VX050_07200, partial [Planctomycetota bacterium]|nr:hypothetical protein [Planctomycetota bacterium]
LIRVGWVVVASVVRASLGQEERLVDCTGLNLDGPSLRVTVAGAADSDGLDRILDPKIELDLSVLLEGQLENPFEVPISSELGLVLNVMVQHPGGTLEVADIATVMLDGGPIAPGQSVGFKVGGQNLTRQLSGSEFLTDFGAISRLYSDEISIRVAGEVSLFSSAGGTIRLFGAGVTQGSVRLLWDQITNNAFRDWNEIEPASWFLDQNWAPTSVPSPSETAIFGFINDTGTTTGIVGAVANPQQVDIFSGAFQFDSALELNAERLRVGVNQNETPTILQISSSSLAFTDASVGAPQGDFSSLRVLSDAVLAATRLDVGVAGAADLILKESLVQTARLRVGYAPIDALDTYSGRLELRGNVTLEGDLFELQGALELSGPASAMQFNSFVIDDLGRANFPGNTGQVENSGLLQVASGGATIFGDYLQAGEGEPISGRLQVRRDPFTGQLNRLQVDGTAQLAGGLEIIWPDGVPPASSELLSAGSIAGEFLVRRFIGGDGTSAVKVSESSPLGASVLRLEDAGSADPLPMAASTAFDFASGFLDIEIGDLNNDGLNDVAAVVQGVQGLPEIELQLAQVNPDVPLGFLKLSLDAPAGATDITFGDTNFDSVPDLCVAGIEGTFAVANGVGDGSFEPFQVVLSGYGEVADIRTLSAPSDPLNLLLLDRTNSRLRRIQAVNTFLGTGLSDDDEGGTDDDPSEIDPVPGTGKKNDNAVLTSAGSVKLTSGSRKKSRGNNSTAAAGTGDNSSPLSLVTTPAVHVTLHRDRRSFEVHRITNGGQLGGGVEFLLTDPDALDQLEPVDLDLGDFDGDGDADIAVAFATTDLQGLPQGVVRLLRSDWDGSGGVTFVDTPLQAAGTPISAIRAGDFNDDGVDELLLFRESTFFMGGGLTVDVLQRNDVVGDVNGDGEVGFADLLLVLARWGEACGDCPEDLSGNGVVDFDDVLALLTNWT